MVKTICFANAAGGLNGRTIGANNNSPTEEEILSLVESQKEVTAEIDKLLADIF